MTEGEMPGWPIGYNGVPRWANDDKALAVSLFTTWAARTGRALRPVPISEISAGELIEFWADDQIELGSQVVHLLRQLMRAQVIGVPTVADEARAGHGEPVAVRLGNVVVDLIAKRVIPADKPAADIRLTPTEWNLLEALLRRPGRLLSRQQLLAEVWGPGYDRAGGTLRLYMSQLRRKLEPDPAKPRWLITEPGMGYRFQPA